MKKTKRIIATLLCLILFAIYSCATAAATTPTISLSNVTALPGETVTIDINISNNPGIMTMSFCITYDSKAFEYIGYNNGYLSRYTIKDHPVKGQVAFVNDEASDKSDNGVMLSVKFLIKDKAAPGKHTITLANQNREKYGNKLHNSFSNSNLKYIVPTITAGSITVGETCENSGHKYGSWEIITPADCTNTGEKKHTCARCEYTEKVEIPFTHDFEAEWTVDKVATPTEDGIMSRHCKLCDAVTDNITFTYEEVEDSQNPDNNTSSDDNSSIDDSASSDISSDQNSSENIPSNNQTSKPSTSSDTTTSNDNNNSSPSTKTPINNTAGAKNPQSAVENIKDYQENIKPDLDNNSSSSKENTDTQSDTVSSNSSLETNTGDDSSDITSADDNTPNVNQTVLSAGDITLFVICGVISAAIIALAIILIIRRKKAE